MTSSSGTKRELPTARKRSSEGGTLTRANNSEPVCGLPTTTARFSDNPEM